MQPSLRRRRFPSRLLAIALLAVGLEVPAAAQAPGAGDSPRELDPSALTFVLGNLQFVLVHELAHLIIDEKSVPVLGPEEHAADYIAAIMLIRGEQLDAVRKRRALQALLAAADAFSISWRIGSELDAQVPYWGAHALSIQRYYQIACLLYGSDPTGFAAVPEITGLPEARAAGCVEEYAKANRSIEWLLETYGRQAGDPVGAPVEIIYERPRTLIENRVVDVIQERRMFDVTLQRLQELFVLEQPMSLVVRDCGRREAAWIAEERELVMCYELIDTLYVLSRREHGLSEQPQLPPRS